MLLTELSDMWCIYIYIHREREREVWQLPNQSLAAAKPEFGSCQTRVWQLPNQSLAAAKLGFGSCQATKPATKPGKRLQTYHLCSRSNFDSFFVEFGRPPQKWKSTFRLRRRERMEGRTLQKNEEKRRKTTCEPTHPQDRFFSEK